MKMSGCSTSASASTEVQDPDHQDALPDNSNLSKISEHSPLQHEYEVGGENNLEDGNGNEYVPEEEDEDEDADFNPSLKDANSLEASSSLSSGVEDLDMDVADSKGEHCAAFANKSKEKTGDIMKDCSTSGNVENDEEGVMQNTVSDLAHTIVTNEESALITQSDNGSLFDKENGSISLVDVSNATDSRKPMVDMGAEDAICMRTRARYSLVSFTLDELETFLQETDDEDDLQNVDDEEEYRKFLAAVLRGDHSQNLQLNANADDEDEENDADFELELEEALESEPEEVEERRRTRRNRYRKASIEHSKKLSEPLNRPLRPLVPFASIGTFSSFDGQHFTPSISPSYVPTVNNGYSYGFTPHQIGQLHCLIHEHVQLLIQVFSLCVLEPGKSHIASEAKELVVQMHQKRNQVLEWRTVPYPSFCFFPPYIHPSVSDGPQKNFLSKCNDKNVLLNFPSGNNRPLNSDINSMSNKRHSYLPDEQGGHSKTLECTSWVPYICGPVLSVMDVAPLRLVENYIDDVSSAVLAYERYQIELGFGTQCQKEPLFPLRNSLCSVTSDGQGETRSTPADSSEMLSPSSNSQMSKKTMAATLLEKAKNQSVALVPKEIAQLAQRFWPLFNPMLYPHKPPPAPIANRVLFTDAEDELLALGLLEYNTDWKAIQQRFLPCKSRHQIFVRQKNRASSKASENPIKAVRRIKNSPLTSEEIARIEVGLKKFKLDWISIWRFFVPYRDPSLLPRQWRIASGTQKSYKSDANKKAKRRLYELRRKSTKPSPSTWHSSSEKEGDSSDNAVEETNSGDNCMDKEDEAYLHEAFLAGWMPENNVSSSFPAGLPSGEGPQARELKDNYVYGDIQPPMLSKSSAASRSSSSQVVPRPYRARRPNAARLVKLAPDLPPVNLPPSVRVMSQSAFKSSQAVTSSKVLGNAPRIASMVVENRDLHARSTVNSGVDSSMKFALRRNNPVNNTASSQHHNLSEVTIDKCIVERDDSDFQMHPLLLQTPQDGDLRYYPSSTSTCSSFTFFSGKQPQLSLSLFHNPRHIRDAVNFLSKSSKTPEKNASTSGVDFHPLLHNDVDADSVAAHRLPSISESKRKSPSIQNPSASTSTPSVDGVSGTKITSHSGRADKLDLNICLSFTSKNQEAAESRNMTPHGAGRSLSAPTSRVVESESVKGSSRKRNSAPDVMSAELDSGDIPLVTSRNKVSRKVSDYMQDESLPQIIMEQEELSDSDEEFGGNVEFECEEMADSERDSMSDSELVVNTPNEELPLDETDADIDNGPVVSTPTEVNNTCSTSDRHSFGFALGNKGVDIKPEASHLNLDSCNAASPYLKNVATGYEFGPFGAIGTFGENQVLVDSKGSSRHIKSGTGDMQKRDDAPEHHSSDSLPRKRVCRSNSGKGNSSSDMDTSVEDLKNVL